MDKRQIIHDAIQLLEQGASNIRKRNASYNSQEENISFVDYKLHGVDSMIEDVLECLIRLWNKAGDRADKAEDAVAYMALFCATILNDNPQNRFSPIYEKLLPELKDAIKNS